MRECEAPSDPYWHHDIAVDLGSAEPQVGVAVRFKIHEGAERYVRSPEDLFHLSGPGTRRYFHGKPYQLIPDHRPTIGLFAVPRPTGEVGRVEEARWEGFNHQELGNAQGWYYPDHRTLVLWECFLEERYRGGAPYDDSLALIVWQSWERFLLDHSPGVERIVTTWEDVYDRETWRVFLEGQWYEQIAPAAFAKAARGAGP